MNAYPLAVYVPELGARSETFIRRHIHDLLPGRTVTVAGPLRDPWTHDWDASGPLISVNYEPGSTVAARWLRQYGTQVLLGQYLDCSLLWFDVAKSLQLRFYVHAHGYDVSESLQDPATRSAYLKYAQADGIITMSELSRRRLVDIGLPAERIHVIPYGVDVPTTPIERVTTDRVRVLAVGRMVAKKSPVSTLDAFARARGAVSSLQLDYVGAGPLRVDAERFVAAAGIADHVSLHGGMPHAQVRRLMQQADLFVQHSVRAPGTGDEEGLPVAILEAMAAGLPVVATRHAGIPEAVCDGETGYLVEEGDVAGMAERISSLANDPARRAAFGRAGWERARDFFSWPRERAHLLRVLDLE